MLQTFLFAQVFPQVDDRSDQYLFLDILSKLLFHFLKKFFLKKFSKVLVVRFIKIHVPNLKRDLVNLFSRKTFQSMQASFKRSVMNMDTNVF